MSQQYFFKQQINSYQVTIDLIKKSHDNLKLAIKFAERSGKLFKGDIVHLNDSLLLVQTACANLILSQDAIRREYFALIARGVK